MPELILNGPQGRIECRYHPGTSLDSPVALILHPEPNQGGTMNNRVSYGMYHEFRNRGFAVLRFNFRGVGRSEDFVTEANLRPQLHLLVHLRRLHMILHFYQHL